MDFETIPMEVHTQLLQGTQEDQPSVADQPSRPDQNTRRACTPQENFFS